MRFKALVLLAAFLLVGSVAGVQAQNTAQIYGKVTDTSGAVMPGVTVTLSGPVLIQPLTAVTSETGSYQFPSLAVGTYNVKFELAGFKTVLKQGVRLQFAENALINQALEISTVQETVTVTGETPIVDLRDTSKTSRFTQEALQGVPSARDPWVIIEQSAGVAMDRQNVGGSASGQQSNFVARGSQMREQKWNLDGVDITDMNATGGSPVYYDFDAFEEMQISTGGADITMQSPGVGINLVTKSGTDKLRGSGRYYLTDDAVQWVNVTDDLRKQGATSGAPIQKITDYGIEAGGPIKRGRAWIWGSYGKQDINVGINGFFKPTADCSAIKAAPLNYPIEDVWNCLNTDLTVLNTYNLKFSLQTFKNNQFSFYMNAAEKVRNARGADDLHPIETTQRQRGVADPSLGSSWWKTGMPKTYKFSDRHIFSDRFMMEFQYAHVGNNFVLDFHEDDLAGVQATFETASPANLWGRSFNASTFVRPTDSIDITGNYFLPGTAGGDHGLKFGYKFRYDEAYTRNHQGGNGIARLNRGVPFEAQLYRDSVTIYGLHNQNFYVQDTYSRQRMTIVAGLRFDHQWDEALESSVPAHPWQGQMTAQGVPFRWLPGVTFTGAKGATWNDLSPRVGITYDLTGDGRNVIKGNYARYVSQMGSGGTTVGPLNPLGTATITFPWTDANGDTVIQLGEIDTSRILRSSGNYNPDQPDLLTVQNQVDPKLKAPQTNELIVGFDRQISSQFAMSASYIWRKYSRFTWDPLLNWSSANYAPASYTPPAGACPAGAPCPAVNYYVPTSTLPTPYIRTQRPDYDRGYSGFEVSARKRMANGWQANASYAYNTTSQNYRSPAAYQDPTNINMLNGFEYAEESTSSGLDNVFVNAKWIFRASGSYTTPWWDINIAGFYNARSGYPYMGAIRTPDRGNRAGQADALVFEVGENRLDTFQTVDFRVDKPFTIAKRVKVTASMDVFNLLNTNTVLARSRILNSSNGYLIKSIVAPRVIRFGARVTF